MKKLAAFTILALASCVSVFSEAKEGSYAPQVGDVYFQSLPQSPLVATIEGATHSPYSHCGILNKSNGEWVVHEAIGPVRVTKLSEAKQLDPVYKTIK